MSFRKFSQIRLSKQGWLGLFSIIISAAQQHEINFFFNVAGWGGWQKATVEGKCWLDGVDDWRLPWIGIISDKEWGKSISILPFYSKLVPDALMTLFLWKLPVWKRKHSTDFLLPRACASAPVLRSFFYWQLIGSGSCNNIDYFRYFTEINVSISNRTGISRQLLRTEKENSKLGKYSLSRVNFQ